MRDFAGRPVVLVLAALLLAPPSLAKEEKKVLVRSEIESTIGDPIRILQVMDVTHARASAPESRGVQLWSVGPEVRFIMMYTVAPPTSWSFSLIGAKERQVVTFRKDPKLSQLTSEELARGTGVLQVGDRELVLNPSDARAAAVRARVEKLLLEVFSPEELRAIRAAIDAVGRCPMLMLAKGNILPVLAPDAYARDGRPCTAAFRDVAADERDRKWELSFVTREPAVDEFLKADAEISPGVTRGAKR
ncbi:MAG: hypothetical protein RBU36_14835 [Thermoanaerobaculia bacterium]|jgi:hypothetical protein|nr:hypothetical protein [Thermoanaerobaculia bacterium]